MSFSLAGCDQGVEEGGQDCHSKFDQEEGFNAKSHAVAEHSDRQEREDLRHAGQLFIHELTHAWQIAHRWFVAGWICSALDAQIIHGQSAYNVGPAGPPYRDFGIEAQAVIVDRWFGQHASGWQTMNEVDNKLKSSSAVADPYFGYIANNIRLGQT